MYIVVSGIVSLLIGLFADINLGALGAVTQIPSILTIVTMGICILYDNKRNRR